MKMRYNRSAPSDIISAYTDSDWASCPESRRSTSGGLLRLGSHTISFWCRLQGSVSLSSGEAELTSMIRGCSEGLLLTNLLHEMNFSAKLHVYCDSSSARGIAQRDGVGKVKHLETKHLFAQEKVQRGQLTIFRVPRKENASDALTHKLSGTELKTVMGKLDMHAAEPAVQTPCMRRGLTSLHSSHDNATSYIGPSYISSTSLAEQHIYPLTSGAIWPMIEPHSLVARARSLMIR